ncbi:hypothetical protein GPALN_002235 [Globodera pallida]|nr:hypothetical protein GPALN_002235 [Globodera pallida]
MSGRPNQLNKRQPRRSNTIGAQKRTKDGTSATDLRGHDTANTHTLIATATITHRFASSTPPQSITAVAAVVAFDTHCPSQTTTAAAAAAAAYATDTHCPPQSPTATDNGDQQQQQDEGLLQPEQEQPQASHENTIKAAAATAKAKRLKAKI